MKATQGKNYRTTMGRFVLRGLGTGALALAVCAAALPAAAQDQNSRQYGYGPQDNRQYPPPDQQQGAADQGQYTNQNVPSTLTLPAGTVVSVRVDEFLSSDKNQSGDRFSATLDQPLIANGWVVARRGQIITGRVDVAQKAGHGNPASKLGLSLSELTLVDGQVLPVSTQLVEAGYRPNANNTGRDVAVVGTTTALGAIIGAAAGGGTGAAIGAGIGLAGGAIGVMSTHGGPTIVRPETVLMFRIEAPLAVSTEQGQVAFQPVGQDDYNSNGRDQDAYGGPRRRAVDGPRPYPYPYYYYDPYWGYPGPGFGYGGFYGPSVFIGGRFGRGFGGGGFRGGFRR
jgi:hypothetical protein